MHRASETIGFIAAALAEALSELSIPEKAPIAAIDPPVEREADRISLYGSPASVLDIVRKTFGQHKMAAIQTVTIDRECNQIRLTTLLAHVSGEWISSDWPVCSISETANRHRMGTALAHARRHALFALVGISGEDDLDTPDPLLEPSPAVNPGLESDGQTPNNGSPPIGPIQELRQPGPMLITESSAKLPDQPISEIHGVEDSYDVEVAYRALLDAANPNEHGQAGPPSTQTPGLISIGPQNGTTDTDRAEVTNQQLSVAKTVFPIVKTMRRRNKAHLLFVGAQPCLVCKRSPCDAHHLRFAQPRALGRKVSDEFTVPLCRYHHNDLHRYGNEIAWWANLQIAPLEVARELWQTTQPDRDAPASNERLLLDREFRTSD
jgi:hypothetical protein